MVKDIVTFDTLKFELIEELIAEATSISREGEMWFKKIPFSFNPKDFLLPEIEALDWGKGVQLDKLKPKWKEVIKILQSYITCEGRFALVFKYHIMFLQHLNQQSKMKLPLFFLKSIQKMSSRIKGHIDHTHKYMFHHGLIKLIICSVL